MEYYTYANGDKMPMLGLGTWQSDPAVLYDAVVEAVRYGYRHIDCAYIYQNEEVIGKALKFLLDNGEVKREELWITSKLWNSYHRREQVIPALKECLERLQLDYLDLFLVHWPVAFRDGVKFPEKAEDLVPLSERPLTETWKGMEEAHKAGLTRHIGVSNFSVKKLRDLLPQCEIRPENNQVELNAYMQQGKLVEYCFEENISVTAFSPLGKGNQAFKGGINLYEDPVIQKIAAEQHCTVGQVLLKWAMQRGIIVIPKSTNPARLRENFDAVRVALTTDDMEAICRLDRNHRMSAGWFFPDSSYTYDNLWDE